LETPLVEIPVMSPCGEYGLFGLSSEPEPAPDPGDSQAEVAQDLLLLRGQTPLPTTQPLKTGLCEKGKIGEIKTQTFKPTVVHANHLLAGQLTQKGP
jgi:hypothetical protein